MQLSFCCQSSAVSSLGLSRFTKRVSSDVCFPLIFALAHGLTKPVIETSVQALMEVVNKIMGRPFKD